MELSKDCKKNAKPLSSGFVPDEPDRAGVVMSAVNMEMD